MYKINSNIKNLIKYLPNLLTLSRLIITVPLVFFLEIKSYKIVWILLIIGGLTDYFDGFLANKLNLKSRFGAIIDPLVDKIFILIPLIWLSIANLIPFWSLSIILIREFIISGYRSSQENGLPASNLGKYKTFSFFTALILLFLPFKNYMITKIGLGFYWFGFILTIITAIKYLRIKKYIV